jgi:hypothetical protein
MIRRIAFHLLLAYLLGACSTDAPAGAITGPPLAPSPPPTSAPMLVLENGTLWSMVDLRFSPCLEVQFGPNRLVRALEPGETILMEMEHAGCYGAHARATDGRTFDFVVHVGGRTLWRMF